MQIAQSSPNIIGKKKKKKGAKKKLSTNREKTNKQR